MFLSPSRIKINYIVGYVFSLLLTIIIFLVVGEHKITQNVLFFVVFSAAVIQLFVQIKFFLHLSFAPEKKWYPVMFIFTMVILVVLLGGSIWIMFSLHQMMDNTVV